MRRSVGNIKDLGDGRFRVSISAGYNRKTGKRIRLSETVRGVRRDAERALATLIMRTGKMSNEKITLAVYLEDVWLPTKDSRRRKTLIGYKSNINSNIVPYLGQLEIRSIDSYVVERWMVDLTRTGLSAQSVVNARGVLKNAMRAAVRWRLIDHDPTDGTERPRVDYEPTVLTAEQMTAYLEAFSGHVIEPILILAIAGGLRRSEACALEWSDIDFGTGTVSITKGLHQYGRDVWLEDTKSRASRRRIALPDWAMDSLRGLRAVGPLVPYGGAAMAPERVAALYEAHVAEHELPRVPMRDLRNSHGTFLYDSGVELSLIADRLGHSDTTITRKHYVARSHANAERVSVAALASLGARQFVPNVGESGKHLPTDIETGPKERRTASR